MRVSVPQKHSAALHIAFTEHRAVHSYTRTYFKRARQSLNIPEEGQMEGLQARRMLCQAGTQSAKGPDLVSEVRCTSQAPSQSSRARNECRWLRITQ